MMPLFAARRAAPSVAAPPPPSGTGSVPYAPTLLTATGTTTKTLSWTNATQNVDETAATITSSDWRVSSADGGSLSGTSIVTSGTTASQSVVPTLATGSYEFSVRNNNANGPGAWAPPLEFSVS
jgi:hypothetical protein